MAAINPEHKAVLDIAHGYYQQSPDTYSFFVDQLQFNGVKHAQQKVDELVGTGLLQRCGTRYRISETGIHAVEAAAIQNLES